MPQDNGSVHCGQSKSVTEGSKIRSGFSLWILDYLLGPSKSGARGKVISQGLFGGMVIFGIFTSLNFIPATDATAIFFMTPVFSFIFASFMLREPCSIFRMVISVIIVAGVLLVTQPPAIFDLITGSNDTEEKSTATHLPPPIANVQFNDSTEPSSELIEPDGAEFESILGYLCALTVPVSVALLSIQCRRLVQIAPEALSVPLLMMWQGLFGLLIGILLYILSNHVWSSAQSVNRFYWADTMGVMAFGIMGNVTLALSTKFISPSLVNVIRCVEVIAMYFIQMELSNDPATKAVRLESAFGIGCLLLAALLICSEGAIKAKVSKTSHLRGSVPSLFATTGDYSAHNKDVVL